MSYYTVSILWFQNQDRSSLNDYHWSLLLVPVTDIRIQDCRKGTKYDVFDTDNDQWTRSCTPNFCTGENAVDIGGIFCLGNAVAEEFREIIQETPLPRRGENCQGWVRKVVQRAIEKRVFYAASTSVREILEAVPIQSPPAQSRWIGFRMFRNLGSQLRLSLFPQSIGNDTRTVALKK